MRLRRHARPPWVVKLGGSLNDAPELPDWLRTCAALGGQVVVVPGGGPYADAVRHAQAVWGFGDDAAHDLALGAMEQFGRQLCAMRPGLVPAASPETVRMVLAAGKTPVWMPRIMTLASSEIAQSWSVTSDSLAAWLALRMGAQGLVLVKSAQVVTRDWNILARAGVVDSAFPGFAAPLQRVHVIERNAWPSLADIVQATGECSRAPAMQRPPSEPPEKTWGARALSHVERFDG